MGHIVMHDGRAKRTIRVEALSGVIEVDVREDSPVVAVPEDVEVVERESPRP